MDEGKICAAQVIGEFGGGGAQRQAMNLVAGVARLGLRSVGIAVRRLGTYAEQAGDPGVELVELGARRESLSSKLRALFRLRRAVKEKGIDVIHVQGSHSLPFVMLATRLLGRRPKILFTWQDSESVLTGKGSKRRALTWSLKRCDRIYGACQSIVDRLEAGAGVSDVGIFHGGVPVSEAGEKDASPPLIFWIGRFIKMKDPEILIRAAAVLKDEGHRFEMFLAGTGPDHYRGRVVPLIRELGLEGMVTAPGYVEDEDLVDVVRRASIGVQTSWSEGFSMSLLEQMMGGLAIVATDVGDTAKAVSEDVGILIPPKDPDALVAALRRLLADADLRVAMGRRAREIAEAEYSLEAMSRRAVSAYEEALGKSAAGGE